ncbi:hypothetical protein ACJIZ3_023073 [Penstemon smallii]|uniref:RING-CH-type domain-containing protein n=1 Tax=Penstemon smallii TaxID=265156 RepID=A0ABD3TNZ0_9LAMI
MSNLQKSHDVDLEAANCKIGGGGGGSAVSEGEGPSVTPPLSSDENKEKKEMSESNVSDCSVENLDLESGISKSKLCLDKIERDCRICHLSMDLANKESGVLIELGCSCKDDLGSAPKQCAETWFMIRGNKICEICGSIAQNVAGVPEVDLTLTEHWNEANDAAASTTTPAPSSEPRNFWQGQRFLNSLLACMVFAFVISWLFHFNMPS